VHSSLTLTDCVQDETKCGPTCVNLQDIVSIADMCTMNVLCVEFDAFH
jgi:hypothetical protein